MNANDKPTPQGSPAESEAACCANPPSFDDESGDAAEAMATFRQFMKAANQPGAIDSRNKKLMAVLLSIAHHCEPCLKIHLKGAVEMGIPKGEIDEAANLAIAFGGCPAMMFYNETCKSLGI